MCDVNSLPTSDEQPLAQGDYASFILRCWTSSEGQTRVRLVDVRSGVSYPTADLVELPALLRRLMGEASPT